MAGSADRIDPFPGFRFEVQLDGITLAGFSECTGLQREMEFHEYMEGGANDFVHKFPTRAKQSNLTLKRGIVDKELWEWHESLVMGNVEPKNIEIIVRDPSGGSVMLQWELEQALPIKWQGPDLNATQNNVAVETLELNYLRLRRQQ